MRFVLLLFPAALLLAAPAAQCQSTTASSDSGSASDSGAADSSAVPEPQTVAADRIDAPVTRPPQGGGSASIYYLIEDDEAARERLQEGPEPVLRALLERGLAVEAAWYPIASSIRVPCMAPEVYPALVVKLKAPEPAIEALGFQSDPGRTLPNCGVETFLHYAFD